MNKLFKLLSLLIMILVPSVAFGNVIDKLNETGKFTKLNETLSKAGLVENLKGNGHLLYLHL